MEVVNTYEFDWGNTFEEAWNIEADSFHGTGCEYISSRWYMEEYNARDPFDVRYYWTPMSYPYNSIDCYGEPFDPEFFGYFTGRHGYGDILARKHTFWSDHQLIFNPPLKNVIFIGEVDQVEQDGGELVDSIVQDISGIYDAESNMWREIDYVWISIQMYATGDDYISWRSYYNDDHSKLYRTYRQYIGEGITIYIHALSLAEPEAIGYIDVMDGNKKEKLKIVKPIDASSFDFDNSLRIKLSSGETGSAELVDTDASNASNIRVMTPDGIKAWRKEI